LNVGRVIGLMILMTLAATSAWIVDQLTERTDNTSESVRQDPDFFLESFSTTTMDPSGKPSRRIAGKRMLHFPDTDSSEITDPKLTLFRENREPWHVESERGWISADGEVVLLLGKVRAWRESPTGGVSIDIRTRDLRVLPESEYGETDKHVTIRTPASQTRGLGMRAFMNESRVELLADVTTVYQRSDASSIMPPSSTGSGEEGSVSGR
jgi:lipopolysaccharide export system protein LptC